MNKTCKIEKLIVVNVIKYKIKGCNTEKEMILNNGDIIKVCTISYRHWEFDNNLAFLYTTNKITSLFNIQYDLMLHDYELIEA